MRQCAAASRCPARAPCSNAAQRRRRGRVSAARQGRRTLQPSARAVFDTAAAVSRRGTHVALRADVRSFLQKQGAQGLVAVVRGGVQRRPAVLPCHTQKRAPAATAQPRQHRSRAGSRASRHARRLSRRPSLLSPEAPWRRTGGRSTRCCAAASSHTARGAATRPSGEGALASARRRQGAGTGPAPPTLLSRPAQRHPSTALPARRERTRRGAAGLRAHLAFEVDVCALAQRRANCRRVLHVRHERLIFRLAHPCGAEAAA